MIRITVQRWEESKGIVKDRLFAWMQYLKPREQLEGEKYSDRDALEDYLFEFGGWHWLPQNSYYEVPSEEGHHLERSLVFDTEKLPKLVSVVKLFDEATKETSSGKREPMSDRATAMSCFLGLSEQERKRRQNLTKKEIEALKKKEGVFFSGNPVKDVGRRIAVARAVTRQYGTPVEWQKVHSEVVDDHRHYFIAL